MAKVDCSECCNVSTVTTKSKEPIQFCPLCGAAFILEVADDEDDEEDDDE